MARAKNPQKTVVRVALGVVLLGTLLIVLPFFTMDGMSGGFALTTGGAFIFLCGAITAAVYASRARTLGRILAEKNLLAHWRVDDAEQRRHADAEYEEEKKEKGALFLVVAVITLAIGLVFLFVAGEAGPIVFLVLLGVLAIVGLVAWSGPRIHRRRSRRIGGEVYISADGAYVDGMLHTWRLLGARIEHASFEEGQTPTLEIAYSAPVMYGRQAYTIRIPVPRDQEERAREVVRKLCGGIREEAA